MEKYQTLNTMFNAAGIEITGMAPVVFDFKDAFRAKANGLISNVVAPANFPTLVGVLKADGSVAGDLADGFKRVYTFLGAVDPVTSDVTLSIIASEDFEFNAPLKMKDLNNGNDFIVDGYVEGQKNVFIIGYAIVYNDTGAAFVPGTTALDATDVTIEAIDNFGWDGQ